MAQNNISELDPNPASNTDFGGVGILGTSLLSTADDAFRTLASIEAKWWSDLGGVNTVAGTGDAITITTPTLYTALKTGMRVLWIASATNTTAVTLNLDAIGAKAVRKISGGVDVALSAGDLPAGARIEAIYSAAANSAAGAWIILSISVAAATTSAPGIVELATPAEALAGTDATRAVTPAGLYFPTGHLFGLTLSNNASDATNDIDIAAGTARDASDTYNYVLASALTKRLDAAWAVGTGNGGLDTGSVGNNRYAIWGIGRSDTQVRDVLFSTSFSAPTMPTNYDYKVLLGEVTRSGAANGTPLWYGRRKASSGYDGINLGVAVASTSGTSIDFTGIPAWTKRIEFNLVGVSTNGTARPMIQIGDSGGIEVLGYSSASSNLTSGVSTTTLTSAFGLAQGWNSSRVVSGIATLTLVDSATNLWAFASTLGGSDSAVTYVSAGSKALSSVLTQVRLTTVNGSDAYTAGTINVSYQ